MNNTCFLLFLGLLHVCTATSRGFIFTAPKRLLANSVESVCLSLHNVTGTAHVSVDVLHPDTDDKIASTQHRIKNGVGSCMELPVPHTLQSRGRIHLKVRFDDHYEYVINSVKEVHIQHDPYVTLIQTDKPVYKPGQEVKFRILTLKHDLMPITGPISRVWIESPSQVRLAQWLDVNTQDGLAQLSFQLSHEPPQGLWEIKVERNKTHIAVQKFEVREYVLPRFGVTIKAPDHILADADHITWDICAKYTYGQPVRGQLHIKAVPQTPTWRQRKTKPPEINLMTELHSSDGCYTFNISGTELGLHDWDVAPNSIVLSAFMTELGTENTQNATSVSSVIHQALKLEFLPHSSQYFKPGLPYKGKVKVLRQDNTPAIGEVLQLCLKVRGKGEWSRTLVMCKNFTSEADGFVEFLVPPQHRNVVLLSFVATAVGYQTKYYSPDKRWRVFMDQPSAFLDVHTWYSPTDSYIEIADKNEKTLRCDSHHKFDVFYTVQPNVSQFIFHYLVKSRGDLVHFGQVYHNTQNQNLRLDEGFQNILGGNDDLDRNATSGEIDNEEHGSGEKKVDKMVLNMKIIPKMSPLSYLLVYYVREDGETVASTHTIRVDKCFANKVSASFTEQRQFPGSEVELQISAAPESLCALTAVDKSTSFLSKRSNTVDMDRVFQDLSRFPIDANSGPIQSDPWEYCAKKARGRENSTSVSGTEDVNKQPPHGVTLDPPEPAFWDLRRRRKRFIATQPPSKYVDSIQAFDDFGVVVMSDLTLETRPCNSMIDSAPAHGLILPNTSPLAFPLTVQSATYMKSYVADSRPSAVEVRSFFPETWLWELQYVGESGRVNVKREVPHTITDWISTTVCVSPHVGLGIAPPAQLTAFQPFFLDYSMPYSVKRGEVLQLKVSLFNFLAHSLPVRITFEESSGMDLLDNNSSVAACVIERTSFVQQFRIRASELGEVNITVSAEVDPLYPEECGPEVMINRRDVLVKPILVYPEGFPVEVTKSAFICPSNFSEDATLRWMLDLPSDLVEDSARADISVVGDLLGPTLQNLDHLVRVPMGCGEQNMILFVPNLHVINYLNSTQQENPVLKAEAIKHMQKGYQRELNYRHSDGSYSAFGDTDDEGSMWLTAFVVKSFAQSRSHIFVDEDELKTSMRWILKKQLENGCFPLVGKVFHKDMKGGLTGETSSAALTAYVLISLLETGFPLSPSVTSNAMFCLKGDTDPGVYTLALTTYALTLMENKAMAEESMQKLLGKAMQQQDLLWWEKPGTTSLGLSVEMTAYAVLSLVKLGGEENLINALKAVRWISKHRNSQGGFVSTQDTVVALEALAKYAVTLPRSENGLSVMVSAADLEHTFQIREEDRLLQKKQHLPLLPTQVEITGAGEGCALVQTSLRYNVRNASGSDAFELEVRTGPVASVDECTMQRLEACVRFKLPEQSSNMAVLEVYMVTGYVPDRTSLYLLTHQPDISVKRWEEEKDKVNFYFEELTSRKQCINFLVVQETEVENPSPAIIKVYDYYQQEFSVQTKYNTDGGCRNERLPHPQPDISNENSINTDVVFDETETVASAPIDLQLALPKINEVPVMQADTSTVNTVNDTEGLNPQFVNVDHELETPSGEEGPVPSYALPDPVPNVTINTPPQNFREASIEVPEPVEFFEAFTMGSSAMYLIWEHCDIANGTLTGYNIYYQIVKGLSAGPFIERQPQIMDPNQTRAKMSGLEPGTKYRFTIKAINNAGEGLPFIVEQRTRSRTAPALRPDKPTFTWTELTPQDGYARIKVVWLPNTEGILGVYFFVKYRKMGETLYYQTETETDEDFVVLRGLIIGEAYEFCVVSIDDDYASESDIQVVKTLVKVPDAVTLFEAYPMGPTAIYLIWERPEEINGVLTGYNIYFQTAKGLSLGPLLERELQIIDPNQTRTKMSGLEPGQKYRFTIKATSAAGEGLPYIVEQRTRSGHAVRPNKPTFTWTELTPQDGYARIKVVWVPNIEGNLGLNFFVKYRRKGEMLFYETETETNEDFIFVRGLLPGEVYEFCVVSIYGEFMTESDIQEVKAPSIETVTPVSCPMCLESPPRNFSELFCSSGTVYKLSTRKGSNARLLINMSPGHTPHRVRKLVKFELSSHCSCKPLDKVGGHLLLLDQNPATNRLEIEGDVDSMPELKLGSSMVIITVESLPGQPEIVKEARNSC